MELRHYYGDKQICELLSCKPMIWGLVFQLGDERLEVQGCKGGAWEEASVLLEGFGDLI